MKALIKKVQLPVTLHQWLLLSSGFACFLLFVRWIVTGSQAYFFLPWNLFLAFIPYWLIEWAGNNSWILQSRIKLFLVLAAWLLFYPNSFYIITDLFHLSHFSAAPKWFDLLLIFSFAWNGILCGVISLRKAEMIIAMAIKSEKTGWLIGVVMWLSAWGIYIGRFLRYNSWDIITDPFSLAGDIFYMIFHPFQHVYAWGMTICYTIFMTLFYFTTRKLSEAFTTAK
jgi:uncharacterized membrane protein